MKSTAPVEVTGPQANWRNYAVVPVWSDTRVCAASILGISRDSAYQAARNGEIQVIRLGSRLLVPTAPLRRLFGELPTDPGYDAPGDVPPAA